MNIYNFDDYKDFLKKSVAEVNRRGFVTQLARAAGCTHSYLSQVLNGKPELTPDQSWAIAEALRLSNDEAQYLMLLVLRARAATPTLRKHFENQLKALIQRRLKLKQVVRPTTDGKISSLDRDFYYSSWVAPAVHILTSCQEFQTATTIAARLNLSTADVAAVLHWLLERGLVRKNQDRYEHLGKNVHLPPDSIHNRLNHLNWRLRSTESLVDSKSIHYTSVFALALKDLDRLREGLLEFVRHQRSDIAASGSEEVFVFSCDLFRV